MDILGSSVLDTKLKVSEWNCCLGRCFTNGTNSKPVYISQEDGYPEHIFIECYV